MNDDKVTEILKLLDELDDDQYTRVAQEVSEGLKERGIVRPKPKRGRLPLKF
ncbi:MAG: hypothetical protein ABGW90_13020 [Martelella sp.]